MLLLWDATEEEEQVKYLEHLLDLLDGLAEENASQVATEAQWFIDNPVDNSITTEEMEFASGLSYEVSEFAHWGNREEK